MPGTAALASTRMATFPWRSRHDASGGADRLAVEADEIGITEGPTPRAMETAHRAVAAARERYQAGGGPGDRSRLVRTWPGARRSWWSGNAPPAAGPTDPASPAPRSRDRRRRIKTMTAGDRERAHALVDQLCGPSDTAADRAIEILHAHAAALSWGISPIFWPPPRPGRSTCAV